MNLARKYILIQVMLSDLEFEAKRKRLFKNVGLCYFMGHTCTFLSKHLKFHINSYIRRKLLMDICKLDGVQFRDYTYSWFSNNHEHSEWYSVRIRAVKNYLKLLKLQMIFNPIAWFIYKKYKKEISWKLKMQK